MNAQNILGHFLVGDCIKLVMGTKANSYSQNVVFARGADLYAQMDEWRASLAEEPQADIADEDIVLYLIDEGILMARSPELQNKILSPFRLDTTIPTREQVDEVHEMFPHLAELAADYDVENAQVDTSTRLSANAAFNEIVKGLHDQVSFQYTGQMDMTVDSYLQWFFNMFDQPETRATQKANLFNWLVNHILTARALQLTAAAERPHPYTTVKCYFPDQRQINHIYTVGVNKLTATKEAPGLEFITSAGENLDMEGLDEFLNVVVNEYISKPFDLTQIYTHFGQLEDGEPLRVKFRDVPLEPALAFYVKETEGEVKRVVQILTADRNNKLPGEDGYDVFHQQDL